MRTVRKSSWNPLESRYATTVSPEVMFSSNVREAESDA